MKQLYEVMIKCAGAALSVWVFAMTLQYPAVTANVAIWFFIITFAIGAAALLLSKE